MRGASFGHEPDTQHAARGGAEPIVGRLAVDEKLAARRKRVGGAGAVAAALLARHEEQADGRAAGSAQSLRRGHLRGQDPFGVARATSIQPIALDATGKERRHAVEVRGEHEPRFARRRDDVDPAVAERLLEDGVAALAQKRGDDRANFLLTAGRGIDVDQAPRQRDRIYRIHASSSVRVSVRSSRYLTITGVDRAKTPVAPRADRDRTRARHNHRSLRDYQWLPRLGPDDCAARQIVDRRRAGQHRAGGDHRTRFDRPRLRTRPYCRPRARRLR